MVNGKSSGEITCSWCGLHVIWPVVYPPFLVKQYAAQQLYLPRRMQITHYHVAATSQDGSSMFKNLLKKLWEFENKQ